MRRRETFALETTLSGRTYVGMLRQAKALGFRIHLHYLWLPNPRMAVARVRQRVKKGGHDVPVADIRRRFARSLVHLAADYRASGRPVGGVGQPDQPAEAPRAIHRLSFARTPHYPRPAMKTARKPTTQDDFIAPARRAFRRVAKNLRAENGRLGLPLIGGNSGTAKPARAARASAR